MFKKNKLSTAITLILATTMVVTLSGCMDGDTSTSTTSAEVDKNFTRVANPIGTVIGVVQDIQGNPVAGATVSIGGRSVVTGLGGTYQFTDIPVTDVVVNTSSAALLQSETNIVLAGTATTQQALLLTIVPPAGYLGASVTVTAPASVLDYGGDGICSDSNSAAATATTCAVNADTETFIDGFVAQAGTAVLPALNASITGILRDSTTGVHLANTTVSLKMTQTYDGAGTDTAVLANGAFNGVNVSYAVKNLTTTTDANGLFRFQNVPSKSSLEPKVAGYTVANVQFNNGLTANSISTDDWTSGVEVGAVMVTPIVAALDTIAPFVTRVDTVTNGNPGLFNDDVDLTTTGTGIVINFNEPLANSIDIATLQNSVEIMVWNDTGANAGDGILDRDESASATYVTPASITRAADSKSIKITMPTNLSEGQSIHVNLLNIDFTDLAGNPLGLNAAATMTYDSAIAAAPIGNGNFIRLAMSTFVEVNKTAPAVTLTQLKTDDSGVDIDAYQLSQNAVFADVQDGDAGLVIQQLNATNDNGIGAGEASARLNALHLAMGATATAVDGDQALVSFTPSTASAYLLTIANELGVVQTAPPITITDLAGNLVITPVTPFFPVNANPVNLVLNNVEAGWTVTVTPLDDLGYPGADNTLTLVDTVEPTTVLQTSYGVTPANNFLVTGETFGNGGELSNVGGVVGGTPYLNVTAQLLDNLSADGSATLFTANDDNSLAMELLANNTVNATTGVPFITSGYDSAAYTAMDAAASRTLGVAFSEDVTAVTDPTYGGIAALSNWSALNDVTQNDRGIAVNVDLMTTIVDNVFTLAADDGSIIDFTDDVTDSAGNVSIAAVNPKVVIRDAMPPFITSATYNGDSLTLTFNETVVPVNGDTFVFDDGTNATLSVFPANGNLAAVNYTVLGNTLTIDSNAWGDDLLLDPAAGGNAFPLPAYTAAPTIAHGLLTFEDINDVNGNDWSDIDGAGPIVGLPGSFGIPAIPFVLQSGVNTTMTATITNGLDAATTSTIIVTTTHRIDTTAVTGIKESTLITGAQLVAGGTGILVFNNGGAGPNANAISTVGSGAILSADGRTLTITLVDAGALAFDNGDQVVITLDSDWDATQTATATSTLP